MPADLIFLFSHYDTSHKLQNGMKIYEIFRSEYFSIKLLVDRRMEIFRTDTDSAFLPTYQTLSAGTGRLCENWNQFLQQRLRESE
jgi:hypothetical protein